MICLSSPEASTWMNEQNLPPVMWYCEIHASDLQAVQLWEGFYVFAPASPLRLHWAFSVLHVLCI